MPRSRETIRKVPASTSSLTKELWRPGLLQSDEGKSTGHMACNPGFRRAIIKSSSCFLISRQAQPGRSWSLRTYTSSHSQSTGPQCASTSSARLYLPLGVDNIEDIEGYRPGGYHPVHLGDILGERYKVLHKLGSGGFSTTWLTRDVVGRGYFALKILKAEETSSTTELRTLKWLVLVFSSYTMCQAMGTPQVPGDFGLILLVRSGVSLLKRSTFCILMRPVMEVRKALCVTFIQLNECCRYNPIRRTFGIAVDGGLD